MKRSALFSSGKYFKAVDLAEPIVVAIEIAKLETFKNSTGEQAKLVLYFHRQQKALPLNGTNFDSVANISGKDDSDHWKGVLIELFAAKTTMNGQSVDCVRIRAPAEGAPAVGVSRRALPKAAPRKTLADDMDDEIPAAFQR